jgi:dipeptidyl-peptidase-4
VIDSYGRNYPWYLMLAEQGYIIMSVDNRGTPQPRGREWRKCVYRQIGILASADQSAAVRSIIARRPYVDPQRIGVWGWSGGGSMTLNLMFRHPDSTKPAFPGPGPRYAALRHHLPGTLHGLPSDNEEGVHPRDPPSPRRPVEGNLLIVHGTGDDNVHYQGPSV